MTMQFKDLMNNIETRMLLDLDIIRDKYKKTGDKGYWVEHIYREFLREYLPKAYTVGHGEVIDSDGNPSNQTDIIICNEYHPLIVRPDIPGVYFVEGVCAAGEAKTTLTSSEDSGLPKVLNDSCKFKKLDMKLNTLSTTITSSNKSDEKRFLRCPPWFLIALESQIKLDEICEKVIEYQMKHKVCDDRMVDAIFILKKGWVINFGDGEGAFKWYKDPQRKESQPGWVFNKKDSVLLDFLSWLLAVMPRTVQLEPWLMRYLLNPNQIIH